ncbi:MAG: hypothetical protein ACK5R8_10785, partial [Brevundimonas sp.]
NSMFELASGYRDRGMAAYSALQQREFANEAIGYTATALYPDLTLAPAHAATSLVRSSTRAPPPRAAPRAWGASRSSLPPTPAPPAR